MYTGEINYDGYLKHSFFESNTGFLEENLRLRRTNVGTDNTNFSSLRFSEFLEEAAEESASCGRSFLLFRLGDSFIFYFKDTYL